MKLTKEQVTTLENVFSRYPNSYKKDIKSGDKYTTMSGIQNQLENLTTETDPIFYISNVKMSDTEDLIGSTFSIEKMLPGDSSS
jgi:hypothetical protein